MALATVAPLPQYFDLDGDPLDGGKLYFGAVNQNPLTNPATVYWDAAATIPAAQPVRTVNGYTVRNGTPALLYAAADYSVLVQDRRGRQVVYAANSAEFSNSSNVLTQLLAFIANLASSVGSTLVGFLQSGVGAVLRTVQARLRDEIFITDFGADSTGASASDAALDAAITQAAATGNGGCVYIPKGTYVFTSQHTIDKLRVHLRGAGKWATTLIYRPAVDDTTFLTVRNGAAVYYEGSLRDLTIYSDNTTLKKTAINLVDTSEYKVRDIRIAGTLNVGGSIVWGGGAGSIGLRLSGREATALEDIFIYAQRAVVIGKNPNMAAATAIDCDHLNIHNSYLFSNGNPVVEVETGANVTHLTTDGYNAWVGGTDGFRWIDTTSSQVSLDLHFKNVRTEQGTDPNAYSFNIQRNFTLQNVTFEDIKADNLRRGFYLRKCDDVKFDSVSFDGTGLALDVDSTVRRISGVNCFWQAGSTANIAGQRLVSSTPKNPSSGALPPNFAYNESSSNTRNAISDAVRSGTSVSLTTGSRQAIGISGTTGYVDFMTSEGVAARFTMNGTANTTNERDDFAGFFSAAFGTANSWNFAWDAGLSAYAIENNRGSTQRIIAIVSGSFTNI